MIDRRALRLLLFLHRGLRDRIALVLLLFIAFTACHSPTEPSSPSAINSFTGTWVGTALRAPCGNGWYENWSVVYMKLTQTGAGVSGEIFAPQGRHFPISSTDGRSFSVGGLEGICSSFELHVLHHSYAAGSLKAVSGAVGGRCCGTLQGDFTFRRE